MIYLQTSSSCLQNLRWGTDMGLIVHICIQWFCTQVSFRISTSSRMTIPTVLPIEAPPNATVGCLSSLSKSTMHLFSSLYPCLCSASPPHGCPCFTSQSNQQASVKRRDLHPLTSHSDPPSPPHTHTHHALGETRRSKQPDGCLKPLGLQR